MILASGWPWNFLQNIFSILWKKQVTCKESVINLLLERRFVLLTSLVDLLLQGHCQPQSLGQGLALIACMSIMNGLVQMSTDTLKIILLLLCDTRRFAPKCLVYENTCGDRNYFIASKTINGLMSYNHGTVANLRHWVMLWSSTAGAPAFA